MRKVEINTQALADKAVHVLVSGELVLSQATHIQEQLTKLIQEYNSIHLQVKAVESLDLSFVQLLIGARKMAGAHAKQLTIARELPDEMEKILRHSGLSEW